MPFRILLTSFSGVESSHCFPADKLGRQSLKSLFRKSWVGRGNPNNPTKIDLTPLYLFQSCSSWFELCAPQLPSIFPQMHELQLLCTNSAKSLPWFQSVLECLFFFFLNTFCKLSMDFSVSFSFSKMICSLADIWDSSLSNFCISCSSLRKTDRHAHTYKNKTCKIFFNEPQFPRY